MKKKALVITLVAVLVVLPALAPTFAIFGIFDIVYDPTVDATIASQTAMEAANWVEHLLNQVQQVKYAIDTYIQLQQTYAKVKESFDLAKQMSKYLTSLDNYNIPLGRWQGPGGGKDLFGTTDGIRAAMGGMYDMARLARSYAESTKQLEDYDSGTLTAMSPLEKNRIKADAASVTISDSAAQQALATVASVGGATEAADGHVQDLVDASMSNDPDMNTTAALLNRINVAAAFQLATQQDTNKLLSVISNSQAVLLKQQRDGYADAINRDIYLRRNFKSDWNWASEGANDAVHSFKVSDYARF